MQNFNENVKFENNDQLGSYLVAAINIEPGDVLLEEKPLFITTHWECLQLKCAKCFEDSFVICRRCQFFPLCIDCTSHDKFDCEFFQKNDKNISKNLLINNFAINGLLKLLLLMENPETAEKYKNLEPHNFELNEYRDTDIWQEHEDTIVQPLIDSGLMDALERAKDSNISDSDFLHRLCILIDANAFEVSSKVSDGSLKGLYRQAAKMPNHCVPNAAISIDYDYNMKVYARVNIKAGDIIYNSLTNPLMGTIQRQNHLCKARHYLCDCYRCLDPTELGTHMSSIKCKQCPDGYATFNSGKLLCELCNSTFDILQAERLLTKVFVEIRKSTGDIMRYEELLQKYSGDFHPNHFLMIDLKRKIAIILWEIVMNPMCKPSREILERRLDLCAEILPVVKVVSPGYSILYATALYDYLLTFMQLTELDYRCKDISKDIYTQNLQTAKEIAGEAKDLLKFELVNSPEGHLVRRISVQQELIENCLQKVLNK